MTQTTSLPPGEGHWRNIPITLTDPVPLLPLGGKNAHFQKRWSGHSYEVETVLYFFDALTFFHRAFCAAAILFLPAADILRRALCVQTCPRVNTEIPVFRYSCQS